MPAETLRPGHEQRVDAFLATLLNYNYTQIHFFDEASIIATSGNRSYGHAHKSKRAIEVQQYASSVTLTVNVCCDFFEINHFNIQMLWKWLNFSMKHLSKKMKLGTRCSTVVM